MRLLSGAFALLLLAAPVLSEALTSGWVLAKSSDFEIYSHSSPEQAQAMLRHFAELHTFFERRQLIVKRPEPGSDTRLRVIAFSSKREYEQYKVRKTADAYFVSNSDKNYVVLPAPGSASFRVAAHEYAHFVLHTAGLNLPAWLNEGISEVFSTVIISDHTCQLGGPLPIHVSTLRQNAWIPLRDLAQESESAVHWRATREGAARFYAESWALVETLMEDPAYSSRFSELMRHLQGGALFDEALANVYHLTQEALLTAAQTRLAESGSHRQRLLGIVSVPPQAEARSVSESEAGSMIADLLFANGELDGAERLYQILLRHDPRNGNTLAALGAIELRKDKRSVALAYWKQALDLAVTDSSLCYRYAVLADQANEPAPEIRRALERAVAIDPRFDDAHWRLALLLNNEREFAAGLAHLRAMRMPRTERAYGYWSATAYALSELGRNEEAEAAAKQAAAYAKTADERTRAAEIAYLATTQLAVRFIRDANGNSQLSTTRVPRGTTDFNPFVEPEDKIRRVTGKLMEVECSAGRLTGLMLESNGAQLRLAVPDPVHVLMRNGPSQFTCGAQSVPGVTVEYAAAADPDRGILRAMKFP